MYRLYIAARILNILIIGAAACMAIAALIASEPENADKQAAQLEDIIKKAEIQCYALEGAFPDNIYYLKQYGVIFDDNKYYFRYESNGVSNYMPNIYVIPR